MSGIGGSVEQMTQGHLRNVQQLAVFYTGHNNEPLADSRKQPII